MMQNYNQVLKAQRIEAESAGLAVERYGMYLNSVEAAQNRFTASWEKLASSTIDSDLIKFFLNFGSTLLDITDAIGLFNIAIVALGVYMATKFVVIIPLITGAIDAMAISMGIATGAATTLSLALTGGLIGIAVIGAVVAFQKLNENIVDTYENFNKLKSVADENQNELKSLAKEYEELANKQERTVEETTRLLDIQTILNTKYGASSEGIGIYTDAIDGNTDAIKKNIEWMEKKAKQEANMFLEKNKKAYEEAQRYLDGSNQEGSFSGSTESRTPEEMVKMLDLQIEKGQDIFGLHRQARDKILEQIDAAQKLIIEYEHYGNEVKATNIEMGNSPMFNMQGPGGPELSKYNGLLETLRKLREESGLLYEMSQKSMEGTLNYEDVNKLIEANADYVDLLQIENGKISLNTDAIRDQNIAKAEDALVTAKLALAKDQSNERLQREVAILQNYVEQTRTAIPLSRDFADTFQQILSGTSEAVGDEGFTKVINSIFETTQQFQDGEISATNYFNTLNEQVKGMGTNFQETFNGNQEAAQSFFAGLTINATEALGQITSEFNAGEMTLSEYSESLMALNGMWDTIGNTMLSSMDFFGIVGEDAESMKDSVTNSLGEIKDATSQLGEIQELNTAIEQTYYMVKQKGLEFGTEAYNEQMRTLADLAATSGQVITDTQGNVLKGSDSIYQFLTQSQGNLSVFSKQTASATKQAIAKMILNIGGMLTKMGQSIAKFKGKFTITPKINSYETFDAIIAGVKTGIFQLPSIDIEMGGFDQVGNSLASLGSQISATDLSGFDTDDIYDVPGDGNQVDPTDKVGDAAGAYKDLEDAIDAVGDAAGKAADEQKKAMDDLIKSIERAKKAEIDALKDELKAYKEIIDEKKKALDWEEKQKDFEEEVADKTKEIADIEAEIAELSLDDSMEAQARILELQEELEKRKQELEEAQREQSIEEQKKALDDEYKLFEDDIERKIKAIEDFLDQLGAIEAKTIEELLAKLEELGVTVNVETGEIETHHQGVRSGFAGGSATSKEGEVFAKLLKGEVVANQGDFEQLLYKVIPSLMSVPQFSSNVGGGSLSIENLIRIDGDATREILPDLEKIAENVLSKINSAMGNKGFIRGVNSFC